MHIPFSPQVQIVLAICIFFLYDACIALQANEGMLRCASRRWKAQLASQGFEVRWAYLIWPSIFLLHQPVYRLRWNVAHIKLNSSVAPAASSQTLQTSAASFSRFVIALYALALLLFVALPVSLFVIHSDVSQLIVVGLIYLSTIWISVLTWRYEKTGLAPKGFAKSTAIQILLCPPFALNVVKKLSLAFKSEQDFLQASHQLLSPADWAELADKVQDVITADIEELQEATDNIPNSTPDSNARLALLKAARSSLQGSMPAQQHPNSDD